MLDTQGLDMDPEFRQLPVHALYIHGTNIILLARSIRSPSRGVANLNCTAAQLTFVSYSLYQTRLA